MHIVHFSDWHGHFDDLPEADVYICTGDMLGDDPAIWENFGADYIDAEKSRVWQLDWIKRRLEKYPPRSFFGSPDAPVVCVRGNHDYTEIAPMFGGEVYEISMDSTRVFEIDGVTFGGFRGVSWIGLGWSDEMRDEELDHQVSFLPEGIDVMVTHTPPRNILDHCWGGNVGASALSSYFNGRLYRIEQGSGVSMPKLYCFGHIHESHGQKVWSLQEFPWLPHDVTFSNAATTQHVIDI